MRQKNTPEKLSIEQIRALPAKQRRSYVDRVRVRYSLWHTLYEEIAWRHERQDGAAEPQCMLLVGGTRAGKTTLAKSYAALHPPFETSTGTKRPIVFATIQLPATIPTLVTVLLTAIGDPLPYSGTIPRRRARLVKYFRDCEVAYLMLDEIQHFWDPDRMKTLHLVTNWLKTFIKETNVSCLFIGLQGEAEHVVTENAQLAGLFGDPYVLEPFPWEVTQPGTITTFCNFLADLEGLLPLRQPSNLFREDKALRIHIASAGVVGFVMALIREATHLALREGQECLDNALLEQAFKRRLAGNRRNIPNPFYREDM